MGEGLGADMNKDFDAIVREDWERFEKDSRMTLTQLLSEELKNRGVQIPPVLKPSPIIKSTHAPSLNHEGFSAFMVSSLYDTSPKIDRKGIKAILKGAPNDLVERVALVLKPIEIEKLWLEGNAPFLRMEWLRKQQKQLNKFIKEYGSHHAWLKKQLENKVLPLPPAVKTEVQRSAMALEDSIELARAYIRLFVGIKKMWKNSGEEYALLTTNPYWEPILKKTMRLVKEARADRDNPYLSDESPYRLLANLLNLAYPWAWGNDSRTLKLLRGRI